MKKEYSLDKVQLLFPAQAMNKEMLNIIRKGIPVPGCKPSAGSLVVKEEKLKGGKVDEGLVEKINILGINFGKLLKAFEGLKIDQIELWISGAAEAGGLLSLALSAKGEGGIRVVLKP
jgi:hypothetical protein